MKIANITLALIVLITTSFAAPAQEPTVEKADTTKVTPDSMSVSLGEVVIMAERIVPIAEGLRINPTKREKNAAYDATSLLRVMNLPQVNVDPVSGTLTTSDGKSLSVFIDFTPASSEDAKNLRPDDVMSIEYLEYPKDPRFQGAQAVLNFIMKKYEWGGYTRFNGVVRTLSHAENYYGSLYSRFNYRRMTFDLYGGYNSSSDNHTGSDASATFRDIWYGGERYDLIEQTSKMRGYDKSRSASGSLRATYQTKDILLRHTLSYGFSQDPGSESRGMVTYSPAIITPSATEYFTRSRSSYPSFSGYDYFRFGENGLVLSYGTSYSRNHGYNDYRLVDVEDILRSTAENSWAWNASASYSQNLGHNNELQFQTYYSGQHYASDYTGAYTGSQVLDNSMLRGLIFYMHRFGRKLYLYSGAGVNYSWWDVNNDNGFHSLSPVTSLYVNWKVNSHHTLSAESTFGTYTPSASSTNTVLTKSTELIWVQGNPELRVQKRLGSTINYNWLPSNIFTLSAYTGYSTLYDAMFETYTAAPAEMGGVIRSWVNEKQIRSFSGGLSATVRLFDNKLSIKCGGSFRHNRVIGAHPQTLNGYTLDASVYYFTGPFSISAYYRFQPAKEMLYNGWRQYRDVYGIDISYKWKQWNFQIQTFDWFNSHKAWLTHIDTPIYTVDTQSYTGASMARGVHFTVSYTFGYGKVIDDSSEMSNSESKSSSAIIK